MNGYDDVKGKWGWFVALGIALIILGVFAIYEAFAATLVSVMIFGWVLLIGGIIQSVHAAWVRPWSGLLLELLIGILYIIVGLLIVGNPGATAVALTLLMAAFFCVGGVFRIVAAAVEALPNRGWMLFSGFVNVLLGILIWAHWPSSSAWVIGLFVGIDLVFTGWWFIGLGTVSHKLIKTLKTA